MDVLELAERRIAVLWRRRACSGEVFGLASMETTGLGRHGYEGTDRMNGKQ